MRGVLPELLLLKGFHRWKLFTLTLSDRTYLMRGKKTSTLMVSPATWTMSDRERDLGTVRQPRLLLRRPSSWWRLVSSDFVMSARSTWLFPPV